MEKQNRVAIVAEGESSHPVSSLDMQDVGWMDEAKAARLVGLLSTYDL
jgi:hypothetical protein